MGGAGSGRWNWHIKKATVEECLMLTASKLARDGVIARSSGLGSLWWTNNATGEVTASAGYRCEIQKTLPPSMRGCRRSDPEAGTRPALRLQE